MSLIVREFSGEYGALAAVSGAEVADLVARDEGRRPLRWLAWQGRDCVGVVTAHPRPDSRTLLRFSGPPPVPLRPLTEAVLAATAGTPIVVVAESARIRRGLEASGYRPEIVTESFRVSFAEALARLERATVPDRFDLVGPEEVNAAEHVSLDDELRTDVPGTDGWVGSVEMLHSSLEDPSTYLLARQRGTQRLVGLFRMWHNDTGSHLGLIGVVRGQRRTLLGPGLLAEGLRRAANHGDDTFTTGVSITNRAVHAPLQRLGAQSMGRSVQLRYEPPDNECS